MPKIRAKKIKSRKIKEDESDEGVYTVEKIMEKKLKKGRVMYLIKWEGYSNEHNTWEWEEDCNCPELIEQFEKDRKLEKTKGADLILSNKKERPSPKLHADSTNTLQDGKGTSGNHTRSDPAPMPPKKTGFERGLEPEKILGATEQNGKLIFLIKWKNCDEEDLVFAEDANVKCPQVVIAFYESKLTWRKATSETETSVDEGP